MQDLSEIHEEKIPMFYKGDELYCPACKRPVYRFTRDALAQDPIVAEMWEVCEPTDSPLSEGDMLLLHKECGTQLLENMYGPQLWHVWHENSHQLIHSTNPNYFSKEHDHDQQAPANTYVA